MLSFKQNQSAPKLRVKRAIAAPSLLLLLALAGCANNHTLLTEKPRVAEASEVNMKLRNIPPPKHRIPVAVYEFKDETGQYREAKSYQQLSRAVTQGGVSILIKALQDAGNRRWFTVMERNKLANLLKERQIVTEMRRLYRGETQVNSKALPPLKHAAIIIEGGVIGFNSNVQTGGIGAAYLGISGDTDYTKDEITVALRAISTKTGEVLATVSARKTVVSVGMQASVFRYVKLDELLEAEAGFTHNEPGQVAMEAAIEKAVEALIVEGVQLKIWNFADPSSGTSYVKDIRNETFGKAKSSYPVTGPGPETSNATTITPTIPRLIVTPKKTVAKPVVKETTRRLPPPYTSNEEPAG
ncbi:CsgG/HfaB family protein [uncultured Cohaesibacter sp.]|uniref:CsgG/HfaB family protein n=1 Tax=uncultured Cohaesibacter sp. TaxID=1002546 RepID=UPI002931A384|nr:CsgG/HfaB family protein [uncultured Cohaesibacter sp.]